MTDTLDLLRGIAAELGDGWTAVPRNGEHHAEYLSGPHAIRITLRRDRWDSVTRWEISAANLELHNFAYPWRDTFPSIHVTAAKTAAQIARDIQRRILPAYAAVYARARARQRKHFAERFDAQFMANLLTDQCGVRFRFNEDETAVEFRGDLGRYDTLNVDVRVGSRNLNLDLRNAPNDLGIELLRICALWLRAHPLTAEESES